MRRLLAFTLLVAWIMEAGALWVPASAGDPDGNVQKMCPVLPDEPIDPSLFVIHDGRTVYFCCAKCKKLFLREPEAYIGNLPQAPSGAGDTAAAESDHDHSSHAALDRGWIGYLGRFHIIAIHFPIALLVLAGLVELVGLWPRRRSLLGFVRLLVAGGALAGLAAMALGLAHAMSADYRGALADYLDWHRALGIATTVVACAAWGLVEWRARRPSRSSIALSRVAVFGGALLVGVTAHLGGALVFGPGFLVP